MSAPRPTVPNSLGLGVVLAVLGFGAWLLYVLQSGGEQHSYAPGRPPPQYVKVAAGHTYSIAIPGGVSAEVKQGLDPSRLACTATGAGQTVGALQITAENSGSKATNQIGQFVAPLSATVHVDCSGIGAVYIDNSADAERDWSLAWLVLAAVALAIGLPLTLSGLRRMSVRSGEEHQVQ